MIADLGGTSKPLSNVYKTQLHEFWFYMDTMENDR